MSLLKEKGLTLRGMQDKDIAAVMEIELQSYSHPWTPGIFRDCLKVGYPAWVLLKDSSIVGYIVLSAGAGEAHVLNICVSATYRRQGIAKSVLEDVISLLKEREFSCIFLEVRASNFAAQNLYEKLGFEKIGERKEYYEAVNGRENAITYKLLL